MNIKKLSILMACLMLVSTLAVVLTGCVPPDNGGNDDAIEYQQYASSTVGFKDYSQNLTDFNKSLYYINDLAQDMGDPMIVYDEGTEMFYAFGTHTAVQFECFASPNLQDWNSLGANNNFGFKPQAGSWSTKDLWAPDIIQIDGKWYMYYTSNMKYADGSDSCQIGVAVADDPWGPYKQWTGTNANGEVITLAQTPFQGLPKSTILDATVFQDDDGELYMYFSFDTTKAPNEVRELYGVENNNCAEIWGVKMKDPTTWDLTTLTRLMTSGKSKLSASKRDIPWETWSTSFANDYECMEGPYMIKQNGKYFLTYVANSFVDTVYNVGYGVADSPLGEYTKPNSYHLENMILGVPGNDYEYLNTRYLGFMTGTGHASVFKVGDEYMFAYHAHMNRHFWGEDPEVSGSDANSTWRALAVDYIYFEEDGTPYTNGPTYSLQRLPEKITGLTNFAPGATIKVDGENAEYLNDLKTNRGGGKLTDEVVKEAQFKAGTRSIEITFAEPINVKSLNIFNSCEWAKHTTQIKQIDFGNGNGIVGVNFNKNYYNPLSNNWINPHSAYTIALDNPITTNRIVITFESTTDFAVGEIEILGSK